ncbi:hypothetical protein DSM112329_01970 [Paraconexibacter sp. AEG42_29]|uniref:PucR family transcriptional regulator n=1 Tax=Paraconexibacter sp. AEG42_29 TaxID=2997339 RepID=A0AAU7AU43_9ACTN
MPAADIDARAAVLCEDVAVALAARTAAIAGQLVDEVAEHLPAAVADDELRGLMVDGATANVGLVTAMARTWSDPAGNPPPPEVARWARATARAGLSVADVLTVYRLGHARLWRLWQAELAARTPEHELFVHASARCSDFLFRWVDAMSSPVVRIHGEERRRLDRGTEAARVDAVRAILDGEPLDTTAVSLRLRYDLERHHVAVVAWLDELTDPVDEDARLQDAVARVSKWLRPGSTPLLVRGGSQSVWAWVGCDDRPTPPAGGPPAALGDRLRARVTIGTPGHGLDGFRRSHEDAQAAARVVRLTGDAAGGGITTYDDVAVIALLTGDLDRAREFARRRLAPLTGVPGSDVLLDTLRCYLAEGQSYARAARQLGVHENTVAYRVRRALELLGEPDPGALPLRAALAIADALG